MSPLAPVLQSVKFLNVQLITFFFIQVIEKVIRGRNFLNLIFMNNRKLIEIVGSNYTSKKLEMAEFTCLSMGKGRTGTQKGSMFKKTG